MYYNCNLTHYTGACDLFYSVGFDGAHGVGVHVHIPWGASHWSEVNKTDAKHVVDKLISHSSLNRHICTCIFEGAEWENLFMSAAIRSNTKWGRLCLFPSMSLSKYQYSIVQCVRQQLREGLCLRRSRVGWPVCVCVCVCVVCAGCVWLCVEEQKSAHLFV